MPAPAGTPAPAQSVDNYDFVRCSLVETEDYDQLAFSFTGEGGNLDLAVGSVFMSYRRACRYNSGNDVRRYCVVAHVFVIASSVVRFAARCVQHVMSSLPSMFHPACEPWPPFSGIVACIILPRSIQREGLRHR